MPLIFTDSPKPSDDGKISYAVLTMDEDYPYVYTGDNTDHEAYYKSDYYKEYLLWLEQHRKNNSPIVWGEVTIRIDSKPLIKGQRYTKDNKYRVDGEVMRPITLKIDDSNNIQEFKQLNNSTVEITNHQGDIDTYRNVNFSKYNLDESIELITEGFPIRR
jgi:hypothetical protein